MKTSKGLVEYCKAQLGKPYWYGTFGHQASENLLRQKSGQYPAYYKHNDYASQYGQKVHDCSGLIKGYLFCDSNDGFYKTYNVEIDGGIDFNHCVAKGEITSMPDKPGVLVFMPGHVGVYIGKGKVIEARGHEYGVVETNLVGRGWKQWGELKWIDYSGVKVIEPFKDGDELKALDFLVYRERIDKDMRDYWASAIDMIKYEKYIFIKWANDILESDF